MSRPRAGCGVLDGKDDDAFGAEENIALVLPELQRQRVATGVKKMRSEETDQVVKYLRLKVLTCMLPAL